jgi:hypothetical protein
VIYHPPTCVGPKGENGQMDIILPLAGTWGRCVYMRALGGIPGYLEMATGWFFNSVEISLFFSI